MLIKVLDRIFYLTAFIGFLACGLAGIVRLSGSYYILGFEAMTLLIAGIALMVLACMVKLESLSSRLEIKPNRKEA